MTVHRDYVACRSCRNVSFPADLRLGILERLTARARKLACLFGGGWGFALAARHLAEVCGWRLSAQSIKRCCYAEAPRIEEWRRQEEATTAFAEAAGEVEFLTDGAMVNTVEGGWKEIRIALLLKRLAGQAARAWQWETRTLPTTTARSIRVAMASAEEFAAGWRDWTLQLGLLATAGITVLADGAKWIWNQARQQFPDARGVLDIFHVVEHLAAATRMVYGENSGTSLAWKTCGVQALLSDGWPGLCDWIGRWRERCEPHQADLVRAATEPLLAYLAPHIDHLGYCERLAKGQSIGSGPIEGACKYVIGKRLKRNGGRWRCAHAVRMGTLCSTHYGGDWDAYWDSCLSLQA